MSLGSGSAPTKQTCLAPCCIVFTPTKFRRSQSLTPVQTEVPATKSRGVTRVSSLVASDVQNSLEETVRSLEEASRRNDQLIQNCINQAEKHRAEIEELENRTALHIEYAQEKQIEIQHLGKTVTTLRDFIIILDNR